MNKYTEKQAGLPGVAGSVLSDVGNAVTRGAAKAVGAIGNAAPQTTKRFAPQIAQGLGAMRKHPQAVGGATLGLGAYTIGGGFKKKPQQ